MLHIPQYLFLSARDKKKFLNFCRRSLAGRVFRSHKKLSPQRFPFLFSSPFVCSIRRAGASLHILSFSRLRVSFFSFLHSLTPLKNSLSLFFSFFSTLFSLGVHSLFCLPPSPPLTWYLFQHRFETTVVLIALYELRVSH